MSDLKTRRFSISEKVEKGGRSLLGYMKVKREVRVQGNMKKKLMSDLRTK